MSLYFRNFKKHYEANITQYLRCVDKVLSWVGQKLGANLAPSGVFAQFRRTFCLQNNSYLQNSYLKCRRTVAFVPWLRYSDLPNFEPLICPLAVRLDQHGT